MGWFVTWFKMFMYGISWWMIPILILFIYRTKLRKYPIEVVIYEKRGENIVHSRDMAGRFMEPISCYRMKASGDTIPIMQYDWVLQHTSGATNFIERMLALLTGKMGTITLFKYGSKQYKPIDVKVGDKIVRKFKEARDKNGNSIWITVYEPINVKQEMSRLDFEVIDWDDINHMTQEIRASIQRRAKVKDFLERYGPIIGLAVVSLLFILAMYFAYTMLIAAGDRYINAGKVCGGFTKPAPVEVPAALPLDGLFPE